MIRHSSKPAVLATCMRYVHLVIPSSLAILTALILSLACLPGSTSADELPLTLRFQEETGPETGRFHVLTRQERWPAEQTALIVCDMWDTHNCKNAAMRVEEFAPRLNQVVAAARNRGVTIIHAPSNCMDFYEDHPARLRARETPTADNLPDQITQWCHRIPSEERGTYPIDQSDGGCDDDPEVHARWQEMLKPLKEEKNWPWRRQNEKIVIDADRDYVSDKGDEVWNILEAHGIDNVIMTSVHTNMCVLGRPFGLRRLVENGKHAVLMRDMTDTMYNPASAPYVSHFTGTDLIVGHIEKFVCPTITSDQLIGGVPFRFQADTRPHVVIVMAEDEYLTEKTLPPFALNELGKEFRFTTVFGNEQERNDIPGLEVLEDADVLLLSIRRRVLPPEQMKRFRDHVAAGKPVIGLRTSSHAFSLRNQSAPEGFEDWTEFDAEVFGGNYTNHHGNKLVSTMHFVPESNGHPILTGLPREDFQAGGSLYKTSPLKEGTTVLLTGTVELEGAQAEPVAWTYTRADGGRSFYTSLGHEGDFENPVFRQLLVNAVRWAREPVEE
jgi:type 1 glutamine amidotransferase/nicotinamidase-related amidase